MSTDHEPFEQIDVGLVEDVAALDPSIDVTHDGVVGGSERGEYDRVARRARAIVCACDERGDRDHRVSVGWVGDRHQSDGPVFVVERQHGDLGGGWRWRLSVWSRPR